MQSTTEAINSVFENIKSFKELASLSCWESVMISGRMVIISLWISAGEISMISKILLRSLSGSLTNSSHRNCWRISLGKFSPREESLISCEHKGKEKKYEMGYQQKKILKEEQRRGDLDASGMNSVIFSSNMSASWGWRRSTPRSKRIELTKREDELLVFVFSFSFF